MHIESEMLAKLMLTEKELKTIVFALNKLEGKDIEAALTKGNNILDYDKLAELHDDLRSFIDDNF